VDSDRATNLLQLINDEDTARREIAWHLHEIRECEQEIKLENAKLTEHVDDPEQYELMKTVCDEGVQHFMDCIAEYILFIGSIYRKFEALRPKPSRTRARSRSPLRA